MKRERRALTRVGGIKIKDKGMGKGPSAFTFFAAACFAVFKFSAFFCLLVGRGSPSTMAVKAFETAATWLAVSKPWQTSKDIAKVATGGFG